MSLSPIGRRWNGTPTNPGFIFRHKTQGRTGLNPHLMALVVLCCLKTTSKVAPKMAECLDMTMDEVYDGLKKNREASRVFLW